MSHIDVTNLSNQVRVAWKPDSESLQDSFKVREILVEKIEIAKSFP